MGGYRADSEFRIPVGFAVSGLCLAWYLQHEGAEVVYDS